MTVYQHTRASLPTHTPDLSVIPPLSEVTEPKPSTAVGAPVASVDATAVPAKGLRTQVAQSIVEATVMELVHDGRGKAIAKVKGPEKVETHLIDSQGFRYFVNDVCRTATGLLPGDRVRANVMEALRTQAFRHGREVTPAVRLAHEADGSRIYFDFGADGRCIEIGRAGWSPVSAAPVFFHRPSSQGLLPEPSLGGSLEELRRFINIEESQWPLLRAFLVGSFNPEAQPILVINGPQGSAKSTTSKFLKSLVDPERALLRQRMKSDEDLFVAAQSAYLLAVDNLSKIDDSMSDALCCLSTGAAYSRRGLYSNEEWLMDPKRPVILNGITDLVERQDLESRCLFVTLEPIRAGNRMRMSELDAAFHEALPRILGGLLDAVAAAMAGASQVQAESRLADFEAYAVASQSVIEGEHVSFQEAYAESQRRGKASLINFNALIQLVEDAMPELEGKKLRSTDIMATLIPFHRGLQTPKYLRDASALGIELTRIPHMLPERGIKMGKKQVSKSYVYEFTRIDE